MKNSKWLKIFYEYCRGDDLSFQTDFIIIHLEKITFDNVKSECAKYFSDWIGSGECIISAIEVGPFGEDGSALSTEQYNYFENKSYYFGDRDD